MSDDEDRPLIFAAEDGTPRAFFFHTSIRSDGAKEALTTKIENYGGIVVETDLECDVILVDPKHPSGNRDALQRAYNTHSNPRLNGLYVEAIGWIGESVKTGKAIHVFAQRRMGGMTRDMGRIRTEFTEDDEQRLIDYLGILIPDKSNGGRLGNNVYKQLMENADVMPDEYAWVKRHTWQSWREHYKKNQEWFDQKIEGRPDDGTQAHQRYELSRKADKSKGRVRYHTEGDEDDDEEFQVDELESEDDNDNKQPAPPRASVALEEEEENNNDEEINAKKRRVPEPEASEPVAKRARTKPRSSRKGKEKAVVQDDDEEPNDEFEVPLPMPNRLFSESPDEEPNDELEVPMHDRLFSESPRAESVVDDRQPSPTPVPQTKPKRTGMARPLTKRPRAAATSKPRAKSKEPPPVRQTRSRSRSIEPMVDDVDAVARKDRKGKGNAKQKQNDVAALSTVMEDTEPTETQMDEDNIRDMLANLSTVSGDVPSVPEDTEDMPPPPAPVPSKRRIVIPYTNNGRRAPSIDSDDEPAAGMFGSQPAKKLLPREMLKNMKNARLSSRPPESDIAKSPSSMRTAGGGQQNMIPDDVFSVGPGHSRQTSKSDFRTPNFMKTRGSGSVATSTVVGATNASRSRRGASRGPSETSVESFPARGTRARSVKRDLREQEKHSPYNPPSGTKAAALLGRR
ncbi:Myb-DNA-bind-2 domain-containing protein [Mycena kentingensis (nom. inval.)]|nr:Myb-DNA-bind-2 domain-containing protein [Mycena kentingensis (nom. inval.)]